MNKKITAIIASVFLASMPLLTIAGNFEPDPIPNRINLDINALISNALNKIVWPVIVVTVIILFVVIAFEFINSGGEPGKIAAARQHLIWAVAGVAIIILSFSMIAIIRTLFPGA